MALALINPDFPVFRPRNYKNRIRFVQSLREKHFIVSVNYHSLSLQMIEYCSNAFRCFGTSCPYCELINDVPADNKYEPEVARVLTKFRARTTHLSWIYDFSRPEPIIWVIEKDMRQAILALLEEDLEKHQNFTNLRDGYDLEILLDPDADISSFPEDYIETIALADYSSAISKSENVIKELEKKTEKLPELQETVYTYRGKQEARWLQEMRWDIQSALRASGYNRSHQRDGSTLSDVFEYLLDQSEDD